jgi:hypothetical protein
MARKDRLLSLSKSTRKGKKYVALVQTASGKTRKVHFGGRGYDQYRDTTGLGHYSHRDHGSARRRRNYFTRHSGVATKGKALAIERRRAKGRITPKLLSHEFLW